MLSKMDMPHVLIGEDEPRQPTRPVWELLGGQFPGKIPNGDLDFPPLPTASSKAPARSKEGPKVADPETAASHPHDKSFAALLGDTDESSESLKSQEASPKAPRPSIASAFATGRAPAPRPTTPELMKLAKYLEQKNHADTLRYCLGLQDFEGAPPLAERIIVICFDTEGWTADSAKITEVGFNTFDSRDMRKVKPGLYGENCLKQMFFYHIRVQQNAHLLNIKYCPGDPTANRFGQTRFLTMSETQACLNSAFGWPLDSNKPKLGLCPVILLGHALGGDLDKLQNTLGWNPQSLGNIVKIIDTQRIIRDVGWWDKRDQIGLPAIVARCSFTYRNAHTASNDAAMTTIAALQMVLPGAKAWKDDDPTRPIQQVIDEVELRSQNHNWTWGSPKFCLRCGSRTHMQEDLDIDGQSCRVHVRCDRCIEKGRHSASFSHVTERCIQYALAHGNSALAAKKTDEEKAAKKAKYMNRSFQRDPLEKTGMADEWRASRARVAYEPQPLPYGPGGLLDPPLESAVGGRPAVLWGTINGFGSNLPGPFGSRTSHLGGRKTSDSDDSEGSSSQGSSDKGSSPEGGSSPEVSSLECCSPQHTSEEDKSDQGSSGSNTTLLDSPQTEN